MVKNKTSIPHLFGRERYETDKGTTVYVGYDELTSDSHQAVLDCGLVTFSATNEHNGRSHGKNMMRSIMRVKGSRPMGDGMYVFLEIDTNNLPATQRQLDGR